MTTEEDPADRREAFDREAAAPRPGWTVEEEHGVEEWTKEAAGLRGYVMGLPAVDQLGPGFWEFRVVRVEGEQIIGTGHSSRRGWAMDGADSYFPSLN